MKIETPTDEDIDAYLSRKNTVASSVATPSVVAQGNDDLTVTTPTDEDISAYTETKNQYKYEPEEYVPFEERQEKVIEERPAEPVSVKELEEDAAFIEDILQHRKDRFGIEKDEGSYNLLFGGIVGATQEQTPKNIVDDYLDYYRFMRTNPMDAGFELNWLKDLKQKEESAIEAGDTEAANNFAEQRERALRLYQKADSLAGFFDKKRYQDMTFSETMNDIFGAAGATSMAIISDPFTVLTAGAGRVVAGYATAANQPLRSAIIAAATATPLEAGAAAATDVAVQKAEIEMGIKDEIDLKRTATIAGVAGATAGLISGAGAAITAKRVDKVTRGQISEAMEKIQEKQTAAAAAKNAELGETSDEIRERLAAGIVEVYGEKAIIRNKKGKITGLDSKVIRESEYAGRIKERLDLDVDDFEPALSFSTFERVTAATGEIIEAVRKGTARFTDDVTGKEIEEFSAPLQKTERVSERLLNILSNASEESMDVTTEILGRYGITQRELAATLFTDASWAGKRLRELRSLSDIVGNASRKQSIGEAAEQAEANEVAKKTMASTFRRLEDIRRLTLVSGIATAVRNNISQVIRSGVELPVYALESAINPNKKFGVRNSFAQLQHTFYDQKDAAVITQFLLDMHTKQKQRFYNQFSGEVKNVLNKKNPGQAAVSKNGKKLGSETPILDRWESVVTSFNYLNRFQEAMYRNGMFTASIQRQLFDKGVDMLDVLKSGKLTENISEGMIAKAVDDALEFTYASQPKVEYFRNINNFIVKSGLTLGIPFPRFMFKAMEMTFNYNITGASTALVRMGFAAAKGQKISDSVFRQMAEGVAGGLPLLTLGYMLRDPDGPHAGSEWYNLKDGRGNEFDARPFFPLTPYLLFGEIMHRFIDKRPGGVVDPRELVQGLTGANFRGTGAASKMLEDIANWAASGDDPVGFEYSMRDLGKYIGEAVSGYGQFAYQFADIFADGNQRMRDYKDDVIIGGEDGISFQTGVRNFLGGFASPFESRLKRVAESVGFEIEDPWREDPRFEEVPTRVMPFFKILFGATLTQAPPKYVVELNRMGFTYVDFMAKTNSASVDRMLNREMGRAMQEEMPELLAAAREDYGDNDKAIALEVKNYISTMKSMLYADVKMMGEESQHQANLQRFIRMGPYARKAAIDSFKKLNDGRSPVFENSEQGQSDVLSLIDIGKNNFKRYSKQRKQ